MNNDGHVTLSKMARYVGVAHRFADDIPETFEQHIHLEIPLDTTMG